jgi:hypothetical protein
MTIIRKIQLGYAGLVLAAALLVVVNGVEMALVRSSQAEVSDSQQQTRSANQLVASVIGMRDSIRVFGSPTSTLGPRPSRLFSTAPWRMRARPPIPTIVRRSRT